MLARWSSSALDVTKLWGGGGVAAAGGVSDEFWCIYKLLLLQHQTKILPVSVFSQETFAKILLLCLLCFFLQGRSWDRLICLTSSCCGFNDTSWDCLRSLDKAAALFLESQCFDFHVSKCTNIIPYLFCNGFVCAFRNKKQSERRRTVLVTVLLLY